jgi:hypothetical protein
MPSSPTGQTAARNLGSGEIGPTKQHTMNSRTKAHEAEDNDQGGLKIKKLALRLTINNRNLEKEIKRAFDLAKSSGQELDLTFLPEAT